MRGGRRTENHAPTVIDIVIAAAQHLAGDEQAQHQSPDGERNLRHGTRRAVSAMRGTTTDNLRNITVHHSDPEYWK